MVCQVVENTHNLPNVVSKTTSPVAGDDIAIVTLY
jgi:hypothetical protein